MSFFHRPKYLQVLASGSLCIKFVNINITIKNIYGYLSLAKNYVSYRLRPKYTSVNFWKKESFFPLVLPSGSLHIKFVNISIMINNFCGFLPLTNIFVAYSLRPKPVSVNLWKKHDFYYLAKSFNSVSIKIVAHEVCEY